MGNEINVAWARNQLTVTKYKDNERDASSVYGMFDSLEPTVNFTKFYADDDNIVDQDLVTWISMGVHHIAHTEDYPITPTPGCHIGFSLLPYNYFKECPSSQSRDSIRVEYKDPKHPEQGAKVVRYGNPEEPHCIPKSINYDKQVEDNPSCALEVPMGHSKPSEGEIKDHH